MVHIDAYIVKAEGYALVVQNSVLSRTYFYGSPEFNEIKSAIELALLNGCKAILEYNNIPSVGTGELDIIMFVVSHHPMGEMVHRIWNFKIEWENCILNQNDDFAMQYLNELAVNLCNFVAFLRENLI